MGTVTSYSISLRQEVRHQNSGQILWMHTYTLLRIRGVPTARLRTNRFRIGQDGSEFHRKQWRCQSPNKDSGHICRVLALTHGYHSGRAFCREVLRRSDRPAVGSSGNELDEGCGIVIGNDILHQRLMHSSSRYLFEYTPCLMHLRYLLSLTHCGIGHLQPDFLVKSRQSTHQYANW